MRIFLVLFIGSFITLSSQHASANTDPSMAKITGQCLGVVSDLYKKRDSLKKKKPTTPFVLSGPLDKEHDQVLAKATNKMDAEMEFITNKGHDLVQACVQAYVDLANRCGSIKDSEKSEQCGNEHSGDVFAAMEKHSPFLMFVRKK